MAVNLSPIGNDAPFVDSSGNPLSGGLLYAYLAGSSTAQDTYTTSAGSVANANPVVLNSNGYPASGGSVVEIWLTAGVTYKFVLKTSAGVTVWERDNIDGINDTSVSIDQWVASGMTPTYVSATSFTVSGDQTATLQVGRRVKSTNSGGTIYSVITASAYGALTTVTVANDSGTLDAGLSAFSIGLLTPTDPSAPIPLDTYPLVSGSADRTKKLRFEVDGFTTASTRVITPPDANLTIAAIAAKGDIIAGSAAGVQSAVTVGANGTYLGADTGAAAGVSWSVPTLSKVTNSLGADVALNNTGNFFDGPSCAQGTSGTWFASGTVTLNDTAGSGVYEVKLWDGTTVIASSRLAYGGGANQIISCTLSGYLATPAANIKISVKDTASTSGLILFNSSGNSKDSTLSVVRVG